MPIKRLQPPSGYLKADLHCHSFYSGKTGHMTAFEPMDSYSSPERIYRTARQRGMDLVTITDHDSVDGCLSFLDHHPDTNDFFIGEEVTVQVPEFKKSVHIAVYDITESQHREITYLKRNFDDTVAYLKSNNIIHALNHLFHCFPSSQQGRAFLQKMLTSFDLLEGLNGAIDHGHNNIMQQLGILFLGKNLVAGSDSHTLLRLGSCYTACEAADKSEFLQKLREGKTLIGGSYGRFHYMFNDAMGVYLNYFRDLVFRREVHVHWPFWKDMRNAAGWIVCLPIFLTGAFGGLLVRHWIERFRQKEYEALIAELSNHSWINDAAANRGDPEFA